MFTEQAVILKNSEFLAFTCKTYGTYVICIKNNNFNINYVNVVYLTCEWAKLTVFDNNGLLRKIEKR